MLVDKTRTSIEKTRKTVNEIKVSNGKIGLIYLKDLLVLLSISSVIDGIFYTLDNKKTAREYNEIKYKKELNMVGKNQLVAIGPATITSLSLKGINDKKKIDNAIKTGEDFNDVFDSVKKKVLSSLDKHSAKLDTIEYIIRMLKKNKEG